MPLEPKNSKTQNPATQTAGETIGDKVELELVRDSKNATRLLLLRCSPRPVVGPRQELGGKMYVPPNVDAKMVERLHLPTRATPFVSTGKLFGEIVNLFVNFGGLNKGQAFLATSVAFATHFWDCAQVAPCLVFSGSETFQAAQLLKLFACVTRHPLLLSSLGSSLHDVPSQLRPTILLFQPGRSQMVKRLHAASHIRDFLVPRQGKLDDLFGPKIMYLGDRKLKGLTADTNISMAVSPAPPGTPVLTGTIEKSLADDFQAKMLRYRIDNFGKVRRSDFDAPQFSGSVRVLARFLGACVPDDRKLQTEILHALGGQDASARAALAMRPESLLIEALLVLCHESESVVYVGAVTKTLNGILKNRGETLQIPPRAVGPRIAALGLFTKRDGNGYAFTLTNDIRRQVHQLASSYSVPSVLEGTTKCPLCAEFAVPV